MSTAAGGAGAAPAAAGAFYPSWVAKQTRRDEKARNRTRTPPKARGTLSAWNGDSVFLRDHDEGGDEDESTEQKDELQAATCTPTAAGGMGMLSLQNKLKRSYHCPHGVKCPTELSLTKLEAQFRNREQWWQSEYAKLAEKVKSQLERVKASTTHYAREYGQVPTWCDPTLSELVRRRKQMAELDFIVEAHKFYVNLNVKRKFFFPWKDMSGAGANGLLRQIDNLTKANAKIKAEKEAQDVEMGKMRKELDVTKTLLRQAQELHRFASEDAVGQRRLKTSYKKEVVRLEGRLELALQKIDALEKELVYVRGRLKELTEQVIRLEGSLKKEKQKSEQLQDEVWRLEDEARKLQKKLDAVAAHTEYWRKKYNDLLKGKKKGPSAKELAAKKGKNWFGTTCDFCGAPCFRLKPCEECGHLTESAPVVWRAGWRLKLPKSLLAWKSVFNYDRGAKGNSLLMVSQNLEHLVKERRKKEGDGGGGGMSGSANGSGGNYVNHNLSAGREEEGENDAETIFMPPAPELTVDDSGYVREGVVDGRTATRGYGGSNSPGPATPYKTKVS
mmetsp:Transcript_24968/g.62807  ORF Transcript_24968/g.62807 Transcript_24968/m.62807 type:complete len:559 (+) Transcript_24968:81-1757(+)|eukprot:CAMPEP_0178989228 /NCGR_PEP_ID=MMETSP0795-20121207/4245_1 /TAXON_ID=88552 /ORGANISM="Amoebophrya sp., Strain Ameob2" /LENGTH=558 /DNA_ID=CAMNT_0020680581 /DNA_START=49 /DNA_END=1725 /DNA_ORIENTATION=+